jgi:glutaminase
MHRALCGELKVQNWATFTETFDRMFEEARPNKAGNVATYIPTLAGVDPNHFAAAFCSVDGQVHAVGDFKTKFCIQSCCKPINYAIALERHGHSVVDVHVGSEPSGRKFNAMSLNEHPPAPARTPIPHNPLVNAGAIMTCALIDGESEDHRLNVVKSVWDRMAGSTEKCTHDEETAVGESRTANRNKCLAYMMAEKGSFPADVDIEETLEFYFRACSLEQDAETMAKVAATLANGGVCPMNRDRVLQADTVRDVLSVVYSCGMYDYTGEFSFRMGFPAKSGVAGALLVVFPNIGGLVVWSPALDRNGNSVRGIDFCERFAKACFVHCFEAAHGSNPKLDLTVYAGSARNELGEAVIKAAV